MKREGAFDRPEISELEERLVDLRRQKQDVEETHEFRQIQRSIDGLRKRLAARKELVDELEGGDRR